MGVNRMTRHSRWLVCLVVGAFFMENLHATVISHFVVLAVLTLLSLPDVWRLPVDAGRSIHHPDAF